MIHTNAEGVSGRTSECDSGGEGTVIQAAGAGGRKRIGYRYKRIPLLKNGISQSIEFLSKGKPQRGRKAASPLDTPWL